MSSLSDKLLESSDVTASDDWDATYKSLPVVIAEDPMTCVARGGGRALEIMDKYDIDLLSTE